MCMVIATKLLPEALRVLPKGYNPKTKKLLQPVINVKPIKKMNNKSDNRC